MMNLPGGARDIRHLLSVPATIAVPPDAPEWATVVWQSLPGTATGEQRQQAQRLMHLRQATDEWCVAQRVPTLHVGEAAFYACVGTAPADDVLASLIARAVIWIYALDDGFDHPSLAPATLWADLFHARHALLADLPTDAARRLVRQQFVTCQRAMRQEALWNASLRAGDSAQWPVMARYLRNGVRSIGILPVMALCCALASSPHDLWRQCRPLIEVGGCVIRLANDIGTHASDVAAGKLNALMVALRETGEHESARDRVLALLHTYVRSAYQGIDTIPPTALSYCLWHVMAFAYAVYGADGAFTG